MRNIIRKTANSNLIKFIFCCLFFFILINPSLEDIFSYGASQDHSRQAGLKREKNNSLDAVYIGSSNAHQYFSPPLAWENHGIAVYMYAISAMPGQSIKYKIIEAEKTQKSALMIINLNVFTNTNINPQKIHYVSDYMEPSVNKLSMIFDLCRTANIRGLEINEFLFPIIRFHSRWTKLSESDFIVKDRRTKGASLGSDLAAIENVKDKFVYVGNKTEMTDEQYTVISDLVNFLKKEQTNVLFVTVPQVINKTKQGQLNAIEDYLIMQGFDVLDLMEKTDEIGIDFEFDFLDENHTNYHGRIKVTDYISKYLIDNYGFTDKRNQSGYQSWDDSVPIYHDWIDPYVFDFELDHSPRDYDLLPPSGLQGKAQDKAITLKWNTSEGADGYVIFRKSSLTSQKNWMRIADLTADEREFIDEKINTRYKYTYTVFSYRIVDGQKIYGKLNNDMVTLNF